MRRERREKKNEMQRNVTRSRSQGRKGRKIKKEGNNKIVAEEKKKTKKLIINKLRDLKSKVKQQGNMKDEIKE